MGGMIVKLHAPRPQAFNKGVLRQYLLKVTGFWPELDQQLVGKCEVRIVDNPALEKAFRRFGRR